MSCCGTRRPSLAAGLSGPRVGLPMRTGPMPSGPAPAMPAATSQPSHGTGRSLVFEYTGAGSLNLRSAITGQAYCFAAAGARIQVDARDWSQMFRTAGLRHVA
jgi:hypothetical protein